MSSSSRRDEERDRDRSDRSDRSDRERERERDGSRRREKDREHEKKEKRKRRDLSRSISPYDLPTKNVDGNEHKNGVEDEESINSGDIIGRKSRHSRDRKHRRGGRRSRSSSRSPSHSRRSRSISQGKDRHRRSHHRKHSKRRHDSNSDDGSDTQENKKIKTEEVKVIEKGSVQGQVRVSIKGKTGEAKVPLVIKHESALGMDDDDKEQNEEMRKRKERLEAWKKSREAKEKAAEAIALANIPIKQENESESIDTDSIKTEEKNTEGNKAEDDTTDKPEEKFKLEEDSDDNETELPRRKAWALKDALEDDDDEPAMQPLPKGRPGISVLDSNKKEEEEEEDEADPLDAFMMGVEVEVRRLHAQDKQRVKKEDSLAATNTKSNKKTLKGKRGELLEQDDDAMEYSSEEEEEELSSKVNEPKKKELVPPDWSQHLLEFRKDFYVEVPDLANMTEDEVFKLRLSLENVKVKGKNVARPIKNFAQAGLNSKILAVLKKLDYEKPLPIQAQAIPCIMSGRDVIGIAKTGSGKTLAFVLPMIRHILDQPHLEPGDGPIGIIMAPTRELTVQIYNECRRFAKPNGLHSVCVYGGTGISEQIADLKRGAEIIVCTPGRMIDMLCANGGRVTNLIRVTYLVLDEADRMFDMGFEPQVTKILECTRKTRQTVLFSATFPRQMEALARKVLRQPIEINVGGRSVVAKEVEQHVIVIDEDEKFLKLLELLGMYSNDGLVLVFVERQESADSLLKDLITAGYPCCALHGGMDQGDRDSFLEDFKAGNSTLMVATSVAARGLDVKRLNCVINYDCPNHYEDYVHRCGRTGRAGNKGVAFTFVTPEQDRYAGELIKALELSFANVNQELRDLWASFKAKKEAGQATEAGSGFGGHGFKFDQSELEKGKDMKTIQRAIAGAANSDEDEDDLDDEIEKILRTSKRAGISQATTVPSPSPVTPQLPTGLTAGGVSSPLTTSAGMTHLLNPNAATAANAAESLRQRNMMDASASATSAFMSSGRLTALSAAAKAAQIAAQINAKKRFATAAPLQLQNTQMTASGRNHFEDELDINDFPQNARWKVTHKDSVRDIQEYSGAALTVKGSYYPPGREPGEGQERKLYLLIEADTERKVKMAVAEIKRILKDEMTKAQSLGLQNLNRPGRYAINF